MACMHYELDNYLSPRIKAKMKTVSHIMIEGEDVEIGSDSDVSDTSQISICHSLKMLEN